MTKQTTKASITIENGDQTQLLELDVIQSSTGPSGLDIGQLYQHTGLLTFDPGYANTASCCSSITYVDGLKGQLTYRGIGIEQLANNHSLGEVMFLLLHGAMPSKSALRALQYQLVHNMEINFAKIARILEVMDNKLHPMATIMAAMSQMSATYPHYTVGQQTEDNEKIIDESAILSISQIALLVTMVYRRNKGQPFLAPNTNYDFITNFTHLLLGKSDADIASVKDAAKSALEKLFILHADHEQNASTASVRSVASTGVNLCASLVAGMAALWGPLHGGASEAVIHMLHEIGSVDKIDHYLTKVKSGKVRLMGFGHRIYKNYDPRASIIKAYSRQCVANGNLQNTLLLDIAAKIEDTALQDPYFIEHKLFPNVDFYSGVIYHSLDIESSMFIALFAAARVTGWVSQWREFMHAPKDHMRIVRPRQIYLGHEPSFDAMTDSENRQY